MATTISAFDLPTLDQLARILADAVTHAEVGHYLSACCIPENGGTPKWERLENAWMQQQSRDGCANALIRCVQLILQPVRFNGRQEDFQRYRDAVNRTLAFV